MMEMTIMMIAVRNRRTAFTREGETANDAIIMLFNEKHASSHKDSISHLEAIRQNDKKSCSNYV